jgi:hypothetical protein
MAIKVKGNIVIYDDGVIKVSSGTTETRPKSPEIGMIRYNTTNSTFEGYDGNSWNPINPSVLNDEFSRTLAILAIN